MRKIFIDCGVREGDAVAAFLGDVSSGGGGYYNCLKPRIDAEEFELIGFESSDYIYLAETRQRFNDYRFTLLEHIVWTFDGSINFDSDGESADCRIFEVSHSDGREPWRHPNPNAKVKALPCIDLARFISRSFERDDYIVVKIDIEGAEYDVLKRMIDLQILPWINELYVEYHWWGNKDLREEIEQAISLANIHYRNDWP